MLDARAGRCLARIRRARPRASACSTRSRSRSRRPEWSVSGTFAQRGIPAQIVTLFLDEQRIEIEKTGDYTMLVLFSIGMTKGKWGTLLDGLLEFKRAYDANTPLTASRSPSSPPPTRSATAGSGSPTSATRCTPSSPRRPHAGAARQRLRSDSRVAELTPG